jgi:hypothetical protein
MKYDMRTYCPKPISKQWLEEMSTEGVFEFYRLFIDLIGSKGGLDAAGPAVDCRFEEVPEGSPYYEKGKKVFLIMSKYEMFGPDGEVYCRKES